ncbi:PREDICTED: uncharacterized protein LOC104730692 [Camelina sativa]|uniref:Uncharacterized protein LOC104730692 n=1 Tax=Camelina sativa TaxID=90675 RepID=A0ABM0UYI8_CAMSA|nr:PREDICTED: uncharacterized protein LOC104730692 [Camelina sativa]
MGYARKVEDGDKNKSLSSSLKESVLIEATMCIIGLQVHVHVKDGSVFSGIFYTASLDNGFGVVLNNARMIKKGTSKANVASGSVVETLVILSSNIVQIIAQGVSLPSNVTTGNNEAVNVRSATDTLPSQPCAINNSTEFWDKGNDYDRLRRAVDLEKRIYCHQEDTMDMQSSSSSLDSMCERVKPVEEDKLMPEPFSNGFHDTAERPSSTDNSSLQSTTVDDASELCQGLEASSTASVPIQAVKKAKEFKLNPDAKIFSPSYTKRLPPSPVGMPDVGNIAYIPSNSQMLPVPEAIYPEIGNNPYMPQAPPPSKFVPYGNSTAGHAVGGIQFPQHMIGPTVNRAQPQRLNSQYQSVQAAPMLVNLNPQVMVARSGQGQLVYIQPVSQDLLQGTLPLSPMLPRPLPTTQHVQYLKPQGVYAAGQPQQLCVSQPFTAGGLQTYGVPAQFPVMQPSFPMNQPMTVAVPNGFYTKFP